MSTLALYSCTVVSTVCALAGVAQLAAALRGPACTRLSCIRGPIVAVLARRRLTALLTPLLRLVAARVRLRPPPYLERLLAAAGAPTWLGARDLLAVKLVCAALALAPALAAGALLPGAAAGVATLALPLAGFFAPELWLGRCARLRALRVAAELPPLLDLLRVSLAGGVPLMRALGLVGDRSDGELARAWATAARRHARGMPASAALAELAAAFPQPEIEELVAVLLRALRHGAPLDEVLARHATRARERAARRMREAAARAGPKIQLVVALAMVPAVMLVVLAAVVHALLASRGGLLGI